MQKYIVWWVVIAACVLCIRSAGYAQPETLTGFVEDAFTGERLIGASVAWETDKHTGVITNQYGFFSLRNTSQSAKLLVSYVGYQSLKQSFMLDGQTLTIKLTPVTTELKEITVKREQSGKDTPDDPMMGRFSVPLDVVRKAPALLGETDIMKTIQLLPGVQAGSEGTVGINVRGGSPDQNLILLDGVPVYNINHLFGFFSVINPDAVSHVEFLKGSIPARYGGRLSSILDITMKEGNQQKWQVNYGISPIAGRLTVEGPIKPGISSLLISGRGTWLSGLLWLGNKIAKSSSTTSYGFDDLNVKWNYKVGQHDRLYVSYYTGRDALSNKFSLRNADYSFAFNWGNHTASLRWNHLFGNTLFSNTTLYYTKFNYVLDERYETSKVFRQTARSGIQDVALKVDFDYVPASRHSLKFGVNLARHRFQPEIQQTHTTTGDTALVPTPFAFMSELTAYLEDDITLTKHLRINAGLHQASQLLDEGQMYHSLQPRLSARYLLTEQSSLKVSYNRMTQFLHLLTNSSLGLPTDLWVPVTNNIPPEMSEQVSVGYSRTMPAGWSVSIEAYAKSLKNVLEYREGASFLNQTTTPWYDRVSIGTGQSMGLEWYAEKNTGRTKGWLSYTLSKTTRQFNDINEGKRFPFKYDRRHSIALLITQDLRANKTLSASFVFNTGTAITLPTSNYGASQPTEYVVPNEFSVKGDQDFYNFFNNIGDMSIRNNFRTPAYHRLDISYRTTKQKQHGTRSWLFSVYNTYNRMNPFYLYYDKQQLKKFSLFPVVPSITYQRDF